ncbi:energy transducer TonB [Ferrimonas lipolytica]|uniref:Protein TonB n=1 Tax=Ferrimonas lipolytica TaxID=2724191 RepID=A0A6H1UCB5_9GAMM|nr:energy transducer TonB [Ferrimonas lipolytica]QIZ76684.1 energy transducer TonB [Ferrimonas lipolytica]
MKDLIIAAVAAIAITAALFSGMALMVNGGMGAGPQGPSKAPVSIVMAQRDEQTERRSRDIPEPPPPLPQMPTAAVANTDTTTMVPTTMPLPQLSLDGPGDIGVPLPAKGDFAAQDRQAMPIYRVEPQYPARALRKKTEGYVVMSFTINEQGRPEDIKIEKSEPVRIFDRAAMKALSRWKYQPKEVDGNKVSQFNQTVKLEFRVNR